MVRYVNSKIRKRIAQMASVLAILVMVPAGITFYNVFQESRFMIQAEQLISETIEVYQFESGGRYLDDLTKITYSKDQTSVIELVCMGDELIPENVIDTWRTQKNKYSRLIDTELRVVQAGRDDSEEKFNYVTELYESKKAELLNKDERIRLLETEVANLIKITAKQIPFNDISAEAKLNYGNLSTLGYSYTVRTDFSKLDTIPVFEVKWKDGTGKKQIEMDTKKLSDWLKLRLKDNTIQLKEVTD